ncbi:Serine/Threonine kinase domain protein (macronuclear) [Tetrahymena thermophila SB210]|uniref:non-specific serine/threonine protein kinase n=1 Tax=Tetrahymena thermophila (strain SB210) TaxID=312017 RepID=Q23G03_TETTS|nr:Serine/Threonine kinase domain protein [Tetrahymena thermophila SB210]EAR95457.2 Serine/Threonine kinase domain protein [Tetrahymena thermophila SB210]|eukprot:XP_001015702.2 Serine/Threonine kinase domain protein [Tetrahymena thermophila SB210]
MGNCTSSSENAKKNSSDNVQGYIFNQVIGKGGFGKVWNVQKRKNKEVLAMKIMSKVKILSKKSVNSVLNERKILSHLNHPLIVNMHNSFQDRENLYLTMDFIGGGDLRYHLIHQTEPFSETQAQFIACCIVSALEYIHSQNILHRDIKPENLIFDESGYLKVTDFGISRIWKPDNSNETSGTPGYIAPEILMRQNYGVAVDYYALGIIMYEMAMGKRPYKAKDRKELREQILAKQVQIKREEIPKGWSLEAIDFINRLIQRKPSNRLGVNGPQEVKDHVWIKSFPWQKLNNNEIEAPYKPPKGCVYNFAGKIASEQTEIDKQNAILLRKDEVQQLFKGYECDSSKTVKVTNNNFQFSLSGTPFTSGNSSFSMSTQNKTGNKNQKNEIIQLQHIQASIGGNSQCLNQLNYAQQSQSQIFTAYTKAPTLQQGHSSQINQLTENVFTEKLSKKLETQHDISKKSVNENNEDSRNQRNQSAGMRIESNAALQFQQQQQQQHA